MDSRKDSRLCSLNYKDNGNVDEDTFLRTADSTHKRTMQFPSKVYSMLEHIDLREPELSSIVSWQPHGRSFLVKDIEAFTDKVLPRFFGQNKYSSFQRQLNIYKFKRILKEGPDRGSYYHDLFLRGKEKLCWCINRSKATGQRRGRRKAESPDQQPDFYHDGFPFMPSSLDCTNRKKVAREEELTIERSTIEGEQSWSPSTLTLPRECEIKSDPSVLSQDLLMPIDEPCSFQLSSSQRLVFDDMPFYVVFSSSE